MARIGKLQLNDREVYAILAVAVILFMIYTGIPIPFIGARNLLFITLLFILARAFLPDYLTGYLFFFILLAIVVYSFFPYPQLILLLIIIFLLLGFFGR